MHGSPAVLPGIKRRKLRQVLDCAWPLALSGRALRIQSARGLAQSITLARHSQARSGCWREVFTG
jgi:hypothetical protein